MKRPILRLIVEAAASGAAGALVANGAWLIATGDVPSVMTTLLLSEAVTTTWSLWRAARFRRKWQAVLDSYNRPALGEGIDIPHRLSTSLPDLHFGSCHVNAAGHLLVNDHCLYCAKSAEEATS